MTSLALNETFLDEFLEDVLEGLSGSPKTLPCKYFYDARGSELFDEICELEEYYPTRTELRIMEQRIGEIRNELGAGCTLIEYGSGSSLKTRLLLEELPDLEAYVPIDISDEYLGQIASQLSEAYPDVAIHPLVADFTQPFEIADDVPAASRVVYFPGSTIGNFCPEDAVQLLTSMQRISGNDGRVLLGVDLKKEPRILEAAYDDAAGVTAEFNRNLLVRINRELGGDFDIDAFEHRAIYNEDHGRVEMHLVSSRAQNVSLAGRTISFADGESIHTENSHKYSLDDFDQLAARAGLRRTHVWLDENHLFSVILLDA